MLFFEADALVLEEVPDREIAHHDAPLGKLRQEPAQGHVRRLGNARQQPVFEEVGTGRDADLLRPRTALDQWAGPDPPAPRAGLCRADRRAFEPGATRRGRSRLSILGADYDVTKPFGVEELIARIRAALRHRLQQQGARPDLQVGDLSVDLVRRIVKARGEDVKLSPKEIPHPAAFHRPCRQGADAPVHPEGGLGRRSRGAVC